jgi:UDP-N-acetylmuramoyl-L-alanyl-D-glutamate--2,6-diaminopimelate ligase
LRDDILGKTIMKLSDLLADSVRLDARLGAVEAGGITADSRMVLPGYVFVAVPGTKSDGLAFAAQAAAAGAAAIVAERMPQALASSAAFIKVENARRALARPPRGFIRASPR